MNLTYLGGKDFCLMFSVLAKTAVFLNGINERLGRAVSWLTAALVLLFVYDVFMRYLFNSTAVWIGELEWHLFALVFLLAGGYTFKNDRHVRVDLFYQHFSEKKKAWINLLGGLLFLLPWTLIIMIYSYDYTMNSYLQNESSPNPGGLPYRFIIKGVIGVGFFFVFLQGIASIINSILVLVGKKELILKNLPVSKTG